MVKYAILGYNTYNIGDDMQSLITSILLPQVDYIIFRDDYDKIYDYETREKVDNIDERIVLVMNAWMMHGPGFSFNRIKFPINNDNIIPFYISTSLSSMVPELLSDKCIQHYKNYQPFFARDKLTVDKLRKRGVQSEYFGCLTQLFLLEHLNLSPNLEKTNDIICVDVNEHDISRMKQLYPHDNVIQITHYDTKYTRINSWERLDMCHKLLTRYITAKKIITSRIHCYLPCRALGLDVSYVGPVDGRTKDLVFNVPDTDQLREIFYRELERISNN